MHITQTDLADVTGLSLDSVSKSARVKSRTTQVRLRDIPLKSPIESHNGQAVCAYTPLSGESAKQYGGRFNRPGNPALYTSLDFTTAWMEAQQGYPFKPQPMTLVAYPVDCPDIVELHDPAMPRFLSVTASELACAWEILVLDNQTLPTWLLIDKLLAEGIAGIVVRSFAPGCTEANRNLVLLNWSTDKLLAIQVIDDLSRLPNNKNSWTI